MKNYWKYTFALLLAAGAAALAGCDDDEELNLPGYPETPVGIVIADSENAPTVTVKGTYEEGTGELKLDGALSRTYIFALSTPLLRRLSWTGVSVPDTLTRYVLGISLWGAVRR